MKLVLQNLYENIKGLFLNAIYESVFKSFVAISVRKLSNFRVSKLSVFRVKKGKRYNFWKIKVSMKYKKGELPIPGVGTVW